MLFRAKKKNGREKSLFDDKTKKKQKNKSKHIGREIKEFFSIIIIKSVFDFEERLFLLQSANVVVSRL